MAGRRRGDDLELAIRETVITLLTEVGYADLTMDLVAARAGTGKASLYRRWPGKAELVVDAVRSLRDGAGHEPDTGTFRDDLLDVLRHLAEKLRGPFGGLAAGLVGELPRRDDLAHAFRTTTLERRYEVLSGLVARGVERGEVRADAAWELALEVGPSVLLMRHLVLGASIDDAFVRTLVDEVIMPLVRA